MIILIIKFLNIKYYSKYISIIISPLPELANISSSLIFKIPSPSNLIICFSCVIFNFFDGDRGFISYYKNKEIKKKLTIEKELLLSELILVEKKNSLLSNNIDLDYLEILYRAKFMVGKPNEKFFTINQ